MGLLLSTIHKAGAAASMIALLRAGFSLPRQVYFALVRCKRVCLLLPQSLASLIDQSETMPQDIMRAGVDLGSFYVL